MVIAHLQRYTTIMRLYFAYGSNMWNEQINKRCPDSTKLGIARLAGYRWIISTRGYANVVESLNDEVEGVLFEISESDEQTLDAKEGVGSGGYQKGELTVVLGAKAMVALVYLDPVITEGAPIPEYIERINQGLADAQLSEAYVTRQVRKFIKS